MSTKKRKLATRTGSLLRLVIFRKWLSSLSRWNFANECHYKNRIFVKSMSISIVWPQPLAHPFTHWSHLYCIYICIYFLLNWMGGLTFYTKFYTKKLLPSPAPSPSPPQIVINKITDWQQSNTQKKWINWNRFLLPGKTQHPKRLNKITKNDRCKR